MELREIKKNLMINLFSSQACVLAMIVIALLWLFLVWHFYRKKANGRSSPLPHRWDEKVDSLEAEGLLGKRALEQGVSIIEAEDIGFAKSVDLDQPEKLGDLSDLQQEIKEICLVLEKQDGGKDDFLAMFALVREKYPRVAESNAVVPLNEFIREHVPFHLSAEELENLWH